MSVSNGNDVGRNEGGDVPCLGFDNRQGGERAGSAFYGAVGETFDFFGIDTGGTFQQTGVEVEDVARIGFASRRAFQQQRDLAVCPRLFGEVVIDDERIFTAVAEVFAHGATCVRGDVLHRGGIGGGRSDDNGVFESIVFFQFAYHGGDGRGFLADGDVDTLHSGVALVDDGIYGDGGFSGLAVADDEFALAATNRHH